jgi:hypothetical protein
LKSDASQDFIEYFTKTVSLKNNFYEEQKKIKIGSILQNEITEDSGKQIK